MQPAGQDLSTAAKGRTISIGTQVVLKVSKALPADGGYRKPGTVGVIIETPANQSAPYLVQVAGGHTFKAYADELSLRREEVDAELGLIRDDLTPYIIYRCQVGSKAYGLATDESDDDIRGIYLPPAELHWSLYELPAQLESQDDGKDEVFWELEKFVRLAFKANPNVLETLWTPLVLQADKVATELREIRDSFLSKHLYKTYSGYVLSQFRRMSNSIKKQGTFKSKHAMHLVRLLHSGIAALQTGEILVDVSDQRRDLLAIRRGELSFDEVKQRALQLDAEFQAAFENTALPEQPDYKRINAFVVRARRHMANPDQ